jgi:hypothetical protein
MSDFYSDNRSFNHLISQFNLYRITQPNLSACWISYLGLKKRHYGKVDTHLLDQCSLVLEHLSAGQADISRDDLLRLTLYKCSL